MAAVWKLWKNPKTEHWERTFAVLTGEPNELTPIHGRMTTFLEPRDYEEYLAPSNRPPVHLLRMGISKIRSDFDCSRGGAFFV